MDDYSFGGRIDWKGVCSVQSLASDTLAERLSASITQALPDLSIEEKKVVVEVAFLLSCTTPPSVVRKEGDPPVLEDFAKMIEMYRQLPPEEIWQWRYHLPTPLLKVWRIQFNQAQNLFPIDPIQAPTSKLTEQQVEELKDKNSPLA